MKAEIQNTLGSAKTKRSQKTDPVRGMYLDSFLDLVRVEHQDEEVLFCGEGCATRFRRDPNRFLGQPIIRLSGISKTFSFGKSKTHVLHNVNLNIWAGDFVAIVGASGSGKSTLLNMIGLLDRPSTGNIFIKGRDAAEMDDDERANLRSRTFGFVFQQYNLIPWLSVYDNVALPLLLSGVPRDEKKILGDIKKVGLADRVTHRPYELSGGEQQRVALLRALANDPEILIGDEPTGNLDSKTGNDILEMLIELYRKRRKTLIIVTHDIDIADKAEEVIVIKDGEPIRDQRTHKKTYTE